MVVLIMFCYENNNNISSCELVGTANHERNRERSHSDMGGTCKNNVIVQGRNRMAPMSNEG